MNAAPEAVYRQVDEDQVTFWVAFDGRGYRAWGTFRGRHIDGRGGSRSAAVGERLRRRISQPTSDVSAEEREGGSSAAPQRVRL